MTNNEAQQHLDSNTPVFTYVSGVKVQVRIVGSLKKDGSPDRGYGRRNSKTEWRIVRTDNGKPLKNRSAAALHATTDFTEAESARRPEAERNVNAGLRDLLDSRRRARHE